MELFADRAVLARELDLALGGGDFEEARRLRRLTEETYGRSPGVSELAFLEVLGPQLWEQPVSEVLSVWAELDAQLRSRPALGRRVRDGAFGRLLLHHTPAELAAAAPACLPALAAALAARPGVSPEDSRREARLLVRDALLAGNQLPALEFVGDEPLRDLLAEEHSVRWLACLGAIRRLWPAPPASEDDLSTFRQGPRNAAVDDDAALDFWLCLRVALRPERPESLLQDARRRMKKLRPDFHSLFMRRVP